MRALDLAVVLQHELQYVRAVDILQSHILQLFSGPRFGYLVLLYFAEQDLEQNLGLVVSELQVIHVMI